MQNTLTDKAIINGIEINAIELAEFAYDCLEFCKNDISKSINTSLYFLSGEKDYSKHTELKSSSKDALKNIITEKDLLYND